MFTKHLQGWSLNEMIGGIERAGLHGADLCVRPGYPVDPENCLAELPRAARRFVLRYEDDLAAPSRR